jgi:BioD-like phosphotransacetylase family protein
MTTPHINQLRQHLLDTLADLRNPHRPMEPDRARAVAQVAGVLVDSARVEVDYLKATGQDVSNFIDCLKAPELQALPVTVHRGSWPKQVGSD